jgi:hypothetical protein
MPLKKTIVRLFPRLLASCLAYVAPAHAQQQQGPIEDGLHSSPQLAELMGWVLATRDNGGRPFIIIDKLDAEVLTFDATGVLLGRTPALIGTAIGDFSKPGIGDRELRHIAPPERTTPAGRFTAGVGPAPGHESVLWIDYKSAVALHAVVTNNKAEHRVQRLQSPTIEDNRITYGCINVPKAYYNKLVRPLFTGHSGVVYILPETMPMSAFFPLPAR